MDYEQKHKEDLEAAKGWLAIAKENNNKIAIQILEKFFPELRESEDERIRKELIAFLKEDLETGGRAEETWSISGLKRWIAWLEKQQDNNEDSNILQRFSFYSYKDEPNILYLSGLYVNEECRNKGIGTKILEVADEVAKSLNCHTIGLKTESGSDAERLYEENGYNTLKKEGNQVWLEKQIEQNPTDKVEPKFKVGDWIVNNDKRIAVPTQILNIEEYGYTTSRGYTSFDKVKADYHLWTIQDAKDGDVLSYVTDEEGLWIMIYKSLDEHYEGHVHYHALILNNDYIDRGTCCISVEDLNPATKEQRDILERAMTNAGYRWNKEELKLEKI